MKGINMTKNMINSEYLQWLHELKSQIKQTQIKAAIAVNSELIMLYWDLGRQITEKQENTKWGSGFIEQLSKDLRKDFPEMGGFSITNLFYMRKFYQFYLPLLNMNEHTAQTVRKFEYNEKHKTLSKNIDHKSNTIFPQVGGKLQHEKKSKMLSKDIDHKSNIIFPQVGGKIQHKFFLLIPWGAS